MVTLFKDLLDSREQTIRMSIGVHIGMTATAAMTATHIHSFLQNRAESSTWLKDQLMPSKLPVHFGASQDCRPLCGII